MRMWAVKRMSRPGRSMRGRARLNDGKAGEVARKLGRKGKGAGKNAFKSCQILDTGFTGLA